MSNEIIVCDFVFDLYDYCIDDSLQGDKNFFLYNVINKWGNIGKDENNRINYLNLKNYGIDCEISENIGNFTELNELWLSYNQLHGEIPAGFNNLTKLEKLTLNKQIHLTFAD